MKRLLRSYVLFWKRMYMYIKLLNYIKIHGIYILNVHKLLSNIN